MDQQLLFSDVDVVERKTLYQGFFKVQQLTLRHRLFSGSWSPTLTRELFVRGSAVAAILYDPKNALIGLVEQFRVGALDNALMGQTTPWCYEVVAGMTELGETTLEVIRREIMEEAGIDAQQLEKICEYYTSPGGSNEHITLYCAVVDLHAAGGIYGLAEECEDIRVVVSPEEAVFAKLYEGLYGNAATLIALQWLQANKERLKNDNN